MTKESLIARYPLDDAAFIGKELSKKAKPGKVKGDFPLCVKEIAGRRGTVFAGGAHGACYMELPNNLLEQINDETGMTVTAWVYYLDSNSAWERIFDFGKGETGPYCFLSRSHRAVCFQQADLAADAGKTPELYNWTHIALSIKGTSNGTQSSAGPRLYVNGELVADGWISQTSSGNYKVLREWFASFEKKDSYTHNYIGHSQYSADADFHGAVADFCIYKEALEEEEILELMCETLDESEVLSLAKEKFLPVPEKIIQKPVCFPNEIMDGKVQVEWSCNHPELMTDKKTLTIAKEPVGVELQAMLIYKEKSIVEKFSVTVLPKNLPAYELTICGKDKVLDISPCLYGLFYEDINHSADGGLYAQMIQNSSFEEFTFEVYDARSGACGKSSGRNANPLAYWFGDLEKVKAEFEDGLHVNNPCYLTVQEKSRLYNRGFCDQSMRCSMNLIAGQNYLFSMWMKANAPGSVKITLLDEDENEVSNSVVLATAGDNTWRKYSADKMVAQKSCLGQIVLEFAQEMSIDMVSLFPENVWGYQKENFSSSAHDNYLSNSNYRLRKDLVETLREMHPSFLRFPGGCISEGSYIWENVYEWKDSVGAIETRKENYNVWGYCMSMGLGYLEYFQLAEDLQALPLPVMACGVLCQARSDYAHPAGGTLRKRYIDNFIDLIDFAISTDYENNKWAALRKELGHPTPFDLHYLGVGNENWGSEFFANFEVFYEAIQNHMKENYPDHELHIISTAGAQADDGAYQKGWEFLGGFKKENDLVEFTDGQKSWREEVSWYNHQKDYYDTIVDEHYYRSNEYLLENADRYNYYNRRNPRKLPKVFVGEYASSDKNTLAGAIAEAAVMTGFEKNSDVVRLAATAPLFNKVSTDGTYRWTPDVIWFDDTTVWRTPNYFVQQMFAEYLGHTLLKTELASYQEGRKCKSQSKGGILIRRYGKLDFLLLEVRDNVTNAVLFSQDFAKPLSNRLTVFKDGFCLNQPEWMNYTVRLTIRKKESSAYATVACGLPKIEKNNAWSKVSYHEYVVGHPGNGTGLRVVKEGVEGYTLGDYSSSVYAGNLRGCYTDSLPCGDYVLAMNYGGTENDELACWYSSDGIKQSGMIECKLEVYNKDIFHSVTEDDDKVYMKFVNPGKIDKECQINLCDIETEQEALCVTLTAEQELVHVPNVNTKEQQPVVPIEQHLKISEKMCLCLPANSVTVCVVKKKRG